MKKSCKDSRRAIVTQLSVKTGLRRVNYYLAMKYGDFSLLLFMNK